MFQLTIKKQNDEIYWVEYFDSLEALNAWLEVEKTRPYYDPAFTTEIIDNTPVISEQQKTQNAINQAALEFLIDADWKRNRHLSQKAINAPTSMTDQEYLAMEQACQEKRNSIIK